MMVSTGPSISLQIEVVDHVWHAFGAVLVQLDPDIGTVTGRSAGWNADDRLLCGQRLDSIHWGDFATANHQHFWVRWFVMFDRWFDMFWLMTINDDQCIQQFLPFHCISEQNVNRSCGTKLPIYWKGWQRIPKYSNVSFFNFVSFVCQWRTHLPPVDDPRNETRLLWRWQVTLSSAVFAAAYGYASGCQIPLHQLFAGAWAFVFAASNPGFSHFFTRLKPIFHIKSQHVATWTGLWLELHLQHHPVSRLWE